MVWREASDGARSLGSWGAVDHKTPHSYYILFKNLLCVHHAINLSVALTDSADKGRMLPYIDIRELCECCLGTRPF